MKFAGFLCFLSVCTVSLALPAEPTAKDVQTQHPLVMESEDTRSVFPEEVDEYHLSKKAIPTYGYIWRYKLVPVLVDPRVPHIEYTLLEDRPSEINAQDLEEYSQEKAEKTSVDKARHRLKRQIGWELGVSVSIPIGRVGGGDPFSWSLGGYLSGTNPDGLKGVVGGGWDSQAGTTFGLGAGYKELGGHIDFQNGQVSGGAGSMPNLHPSKGNQDLLHGSHD